MPPMPKHRPQPRLLLIAMLVAVTGGALLLAGGAPAAAQQVAAEVKGTDNLTWEPATVNIEPGQTVRFTVVGNQPHPVAPAQDAPPDQQFDASACGLENMSKDGDSCTITFEKEGVYPYICVVHAAQGMTGTIFVGVQPTETTAQEGQGEGGESTPVASMPEAVEERPPSRPAIYYAGYGLLALGGLLALAAIAGYVRFAPDFRRSRK